MNEETSQNEERKKKKLRVYTDGACLPNPGVGGWAWEVELGTNQQGRENPSTNQRMELLAVIDALERFPGEDLDIISDSQYVIRGATEWSRAWRKNGWRNSKGAPVANRDLWERLLRGMRCREVTFFWVRGHSGDPGNESVDKLAHDATGLSSAEIQKYRQMYHGRETEARRPN